MAIDRIGLLGFRVYTRTEFVRVRVTQVISACCLRGFCRTPLTHASQGKKECYVYARFTATNIKRLLDTDASIALNAGADYHGNT